ncbi:MAG: hypothetical protein IJV73_08370 [Clostridia bacterium]|nr:hypothetical protein [Clostridia bacterium]
MLAITDHTFPQKAEEALARLGHRTLRLPPHPNLPKPVASHPDMLLFFAPDAIFCTKSYHKIATQELKNISSVYGVPIRYIEKEYGNEYPQDVLLNALPLGKHLFCNTKTVAKELLSLGLTPCHVNQGYTKCSVLPIGNHALITSDASIATAAKACEIDVLQICESHISLSGYDYGFIGGCASFAPRGEMNTVFFCGDLSTHPDAKKIECFCTTHNLSIVNLFDSSLCDIGTIFMI